MWNLTRFGRLWNSCQAACALTSLDVVDEDKTSPQKVRIVSEGVDAADGEKERDRPSVERRGLKFVLGGG
jgi:hypothetical protein